LGNAGQSELQDFFGLGAVVVAVSGSLHATTLEIGTHPLLTAERQDRSKLERCGYNSAMTAPSKEAERDKLVGRKHLSKGLVELRS
jgi:hypothetical protein